MGRDLPAAAIPSSPVWGAAQRMIMVRSFWQAARWAAAARAARPVVLCLCSQTAKSFQQGANRNNLPMSSRDKVITTRIKTALSEVPASALRFAPSIPRFFWGRQGGAASVGSSGVVGRAVKFTCLRLFVVTDR